MIGKIIAVIFSALTFIATIAPWLIESLNCYERIIITLICITINLINYVIHLLKNKKLLQNTLKEVGQKNKDLSLINAELKIKIEKYVTAFNTIQYAASAAASNASKDKLVGLVNVISVQSSFTHNYDTYHVYNGGK